MRTKTCEVIEAVRSVIGSAPAALHEPRFNGREREYLQECLDSTLVSTVGPFVGQFEAELASFTGAKYAVAVVNGTAALHAALIVAGVERDDEVLVPTLTFVATANAIAYCGAIPHFVDSEERTLGVDARALRKYLEATADVSGGVCVNKKTGRRISAFVPMHTFGHAVDIDAALAIARDYRIALIEDAAESLGSTIGNRHTGTFGLMGTLSFNGNKTITTGGGGAIITNDESCAKLAKHITTTARIKTDWGFLHDQLGYNYRMPNLNAALGCAQMEQLPALLLAKRELAARYSAAFANVAGMHMVAEPEGTRSNYWLNALLLDESLEGERDTILSETNAAGVTTRPVWTLMHRLPYFGESPKMDLAVAESLERRIVNLPSSPHLAMRRD